MQWQIRIIEVILRRTTGWVVGRSVVMNEFRAWPPATRYQEPLSAYWNAGSRPLCSPRLSLPRGRRKGRLGQGGHAAVRYLHTSPTEQQRVNKRRRFVKPVWTLLARCTEEEKKLMRSILAAWDRCIQNSCLLACRTCEHHAKRRTKINSTNADIRPIQECVSSRSTSQSVTVLKWCPLLGWWDFYFLTS